MQAKNYARVKDAIFPLPKPWQDRENMVAKDQF